MPPAGVRIVTRPKLALSKDPSAELAAAALQATEDAGLALGAADIIVIAVPAGTGDDAMADELLGHVALELDGRAPVPDTP